MAVAVPRPGQAGGPAAPLRGRGVPRQSALRAAAAAYEHQWLLYRRTWRGSIFGNFAQPVLFLVAMGIGLGSYVDQAGAASLGGVPYLQFLAPALLVSTVMQGSVFEATFRSGRFPWMRRYHAMYATR
jgi:lipooligosaccharide transport system permease protein